MADDTLTVERARQKLLYWLSTTAENFPHFRDDIDALIAAVRAEADAPHLTATEVRDLKKMSR